jgi:hypothetical protein
MYERLRPTTRLLVLVGGALVVLMMAAIFGDVAAQLPREEDRALAPADTVRAMTSHRSRSRNQRQRRKTCPRTSHDARSALIAPEERLRRMRTGTDSPIRCRGRHRGRRRRRKLGGRGGSRAGAGEHGALDAAPSRSC